MLCKLMLALPQWERGVHIPAPPTVGGQVRPGHGSHSPGPNNWPWSGQVRSQTPLSVSLPDKLT